MPVNISRTRAGSKPFAVITLHQLAYACRLYGPLANFDSSLEEFRKRTAPVLDLSHARHRIALFAWLNAWGCRQFAKDYHDAAGKALLVWAKRHLGRLPTAQLIDLSEENLSAASRAYDDLKDCQASLRRGRGKRHKVTFGPTGAAKILYAIRPDTFPPWDTPIRDHFDWDGSSSSYREFLALVQRAVSNLEAEARRFGLKPQDIPGAVGRPHSSLPKLIDEYQWVTITFGLTAPGRDELTRWLGWTSPSEDRQRVEEAKGDASGRASR